MKMIRNNKGQSTIELLMTFGMSLGFLMLFFGLAYNFSIGYVVHYVTFVASRAYLTFDNSVADSGQVLKEAEFEAQSVFKRKDLKKWGVEYVGPGLTINNPGSGKYEYVGAEVRFKRKMAPAGMVGTQTILELQSQSYLGKEPSRSDCFDQLLLLMNGTGGAGEEVTLYDNGC